MRKTGRYLFDVLTIGVAVVVIYLLVSDHVSCVDFVNKWCVIHK